jgi:hypothetical protein
MTTISAVHSRIAPRDVRPLQMTADQAGEYHDLARIGLGFDERTVRRMQAAFAGDALSAPTLPASITTPVQFLQTWLPGFVFTMTQPRSIDRFVGITTVGAPEDEEIVQPTLEHAGTAAPYGDLTNFPLAGIGNGYERRTVVRGELGFRIGWLEERRSGRADIDAAGQKRAAIGIGLDIFRNTIGFFGFNNGINRTYGFLNDPGLPGYVTVPAGTGGGTTWASKTFLEIIADIRSIMGDLQTSSRGTINIRRDPITLALSLAVANQLTKTGEFGISVEDFIAKTYPNLRIEASPELDGANGGANVMYAYAERVVDGGTDGGAVMEQLVPTKFLTIGTETFAKGYAEDALNASAGIMVKRPWAVRRYTGL